MATARHSSSRTHGRSTRLRCWQIHEAHATGASWRHGDHRSPTTRRGNRGSRARGAYAIGRPCAWPCATATARPPPSATTRVAPWPPRDRSTASRGRGVAPASGSPLSGGPCRLGAGPDRGAVKESHAELDSLVPCRQQRAVPHVQPGPADEALRRHPPRSNSAGRSRHLVPLRQRQAIASTVRCTSWCRVSRCGRHASIGGSGTPAAHLSGPGRVPTRPANERCQQRGPDGAWIVTGKQT